MKYLFLLLSTPVFLACSGRAKQADKYLYWVNSTRVSCEGMASAGCLQVQKSETLDPVAWESFHATITGFEYEPGYIYKLVVKEQHLDPASLPADASSIEYALVEILEKKEDLKLIINDIWVADLIMGEALVLDTDGVTLPRLEVNAGEMRYMGSDGCNNFHGGIIELDEHTIRFGITAGTRMMCMDMHIPDLFNTILPEVVSWKIKENRLYLFNAGGEELMQLMKSD